MLKKIFGTLTGIAIISSSATLAAETGTLHIVNQTIVKKNFLSFADIFVMGKLYRVSSIGFLPKSDIDIPIPPNEKIDFNLEEWALGNAHLSQGNIEKSCQHLTVIFHPGEIKTITMTGIPSNYIDYNSHITCEIN